MSARTSDSSDSASASAAATGAATPGATPGPGLALVRPPGARLAEGLTTFIESAPVDVDLAHRQWQGYVDALAAAGWVIEHVNGDDSCPDAVFIEDAAVVYKNVALVCHPGAEQRRPEVAPVAAQLEQFGYELHRVDDGGSDATLDGGDVLKVGDDIWIGVGARTNQAGFDRAAAVFGAVGGRVHPVPCDKALHLKSAVTALPDGEMLGWGPVVPGNGLPAVLEMPEEAGAHVVDLGGGKVLMAAGAEQSAEIVRARGYEPVVVDISEFEKLEGCVTCLSIRLRN